ncbi:MAG: helix-turn-helix domain-containing protein [Candidatus Thermoplasmatota archaeon]|nr:helix-turn-helix domain-containing protein [Candidatus Thermoplasmatota archaeon]
MADLMARHPRRQPARARPPEPEPLLLTADELGRLLSIQGKTLLLWARQGKIPHYRLGTLVRFQLDEVRAWLAERRQT